MDATGTGTISALLPSSNPSQPVASFPFQELQIRGHGARQSQRQLPLPGGADWSLSHYVIPGGRACVTAFPGEGTHGRRSPCPRRKAPAQSLNEGGPRGSPTPTLNPSLCRRAGQLFSALRNLGSALQEEEGEQAEQGQTLTEGRCEPPGDKASLKLWAGGVASVASRSP